MAQNQTTQVLAIPTNPDDATTWIAHCTNQTDGGAAVIALVINYMGPSGSLTQVRTEIGSQEEVKLYVTRAISMFATTDNVGGAFLALAMSSSGGGVITTPPQRFTDNVGNLAYGNMSISNGYAPAGLRWFRILSTQNYDVRILEGSTGNILFDFVNIPATDSFGTILPPGARLTAKGNAAPTTLTTTWTHNRGS